MNQERPNRFQSKRARRAVASGTLLLAVLGVVAGVNAVAPRLSALADSESAYAQNFTLPADTTLVLHHHNGAVTVQGWDRPEVSLKSIYPTLDGKPADRDPFRMTSESGEWVVNSIHEGPISDRDEAMHIVLRVPRNTPLDLNVKNGAISVVGIEAPVTLATGNGSINCEHLSEEVRAETRNGNIECRYVLGRIQARTGNGAILVDERHVPNARPLDLISENGSVRVLMPEDAGFDLDAHAQQGRVRSEFRPDTPHGFGLRRVVGVVAGGGPGILLRALNGTVRIERH